MLQVGRLIQILIKRRKKTPQDESEVGTLNKMETPQAWKQDRGAQKGILHESSLNEPNKHITSTGLSLGGAQSFVVGLKHHVFPFPTRTGLDLGPALFRTNLRRLRYWTLILLYLLYISFFLSRA